MVISGRVPLLLLLGLVAVVLRPVDSTVWLWLLGVLLLVGLDLALTPAPATATLVRRPPGTVRLGDPATSALVVGNAGTRTLRLQVRDAWQPSAGALDNRFRLHWDSTMMSAYTKQLAEKKYIKELKPKLEEVKATVTEQLKDVQAKAKELRARISA